MLRTPPTHGWGSSDRRSRLPRNWHMLRRQVMVRCGNRCEWTERGVRCSERATDCDHIEPNDDHSLSNLQGLCGPHHARKTISERPTIPPRKRERERHPGAV